MKSALDEAKKAVYGERRTDYGHPADNHTRTARLWSVYFGIGVSPEQVCIANILQKIARSMHSITDDAIVDIAGYAENIHLIRKRSGQSSIGE